mgnify:CR=1 FL=1
MKTGRNYKFWFCTGSQDLYGDECLRKVAEHSRIIVEELNKSGVLPFELVWKPTLITNELIRKTFNEANADEDCAGVITWMHTFSPAKSWILGLKEYRKPLCHLHTQFNEEIPYDTIDMDFMNENQSAHGGREYGHIVTRMGIERKVIAGASSVYVTFVNDTSVEASIKKYDGNTGITVLSVPVDEIDNDTMNLISVAVLGNSLAITQGTLALAVGSPLGTNYSILTGNITSSAYSISTIDANYDIFTTDIVGSKNGSGALINLNGEVIGLVTQGYSSEGDQNTLTAISISELKPVIEMLSNNKDIPYIGLEITTVTNTIAKENDIPKGVYIKEVKMDSPAMAAGLQSGDVITEIDGEAVISVDGYQTKLLSLTPGDVAEVTIQRQGNDGYTEIKCPVTVSVLQ